MVRIIEKRAAGRVERAIVAAIDYGKNITYDMESYRYDTSTVEIPQVEDSKIEKLVKSSLM